MKETRDLVDPFVAREYPLRQGSILRSSEGVLASCSSSGAIPLTTSAEVEMDDVLDAYGDALDKIEQQQSEIERESSDAAYWESEYERAKGALFKWGNECDRLKTENERLKEELEHTRKSRQHQQDMRDSEADRLPNLIMELEQAKAERDESRRAHTALFKEYRNIETERDDYRKVLEIYASIDIDDLWIPARDILSRYPILNGRDGG